MVWSYNLHSPQVFMARCLIKPKKNLYITFEQYKYLGICSGATINAYGRISLLSDPCPLKIIISTTEASPIQIENE
jgi:hypothetical protein